jgi:hypothetical protein
MEETPVIQPAKRMASLPCIGRLRCGSADAYIYIFISHISTTKLIVPVYPFVMYVLKEMDVFFFFDMSVKRIW